MAGELICNAFLNKKIRKTKRDETNGWSYFLFGNIIAERRGEEIWITNSGWKTITTKDRLNKIGAYLYAKKGVWHLNECPWEGEWVNMKTYKKEIIKEKSMFS